MHSYIAYDIILIPMPMPASDPLPIHPQTRSVLVAALSVLHILSALSCTLLLYNEFSGLKIHFAPFSYFKCGRWVCGSTYSDMSAESLASSHHQGIFVSVAQ